MNTVRRTIATTEVLLILPAALFMTALVVRALQPLGSEPAHTAERIVQWYAERQWTLWILLIALPLAVLITGCATLVPTMKPTLKQRDARQTLAAIPARPATVIVAAETLTAGVFLVIVILHMLAN
jgi:cytochrome b561